MEKKCPKCDRILSSDCFYVKPKMKDGIDFYCKECRIKLQRDYYKNNKEKVKKSVREYVANHADEKKAYNSLYYLNNKDKSRGYSKRWKERNKDYTSKRRASDPLFKMAFNLRSRIRKSYKAKTWCKPFGSKVLMGCDWETAHNYMESKFTDGMSWSNYGKWHIDHIVPMSSAKTEEELFSLCHYTNLQPLWAIDNLSKGSKII